MSFVSSIWQRAKGAVAGVAGAVVANVPFIGGAAAGYVTSHIAGGGSDNGVSAAAQAEIDRNAAFAKAEADRIRQNAADAVARIGAGTTQQVAAAVGPPGNFYATGNPFAGMSQTTMIAIVAVIIVVILLATRK